MDDPISYRFTNLLPGRWARLFSLMPLIRAYCAPPDPGLGFEVAGSRLAVHGMRDILGMVQRYLWREAISFTFDAGGEATILWREANGAMHIGRRGVPRSECVPVVVPPGTYSRIELQSYYEREPHVMFIPANETTMIFSKGMYLREFYGDDTGFWSSGIKLTYPIACKTVRNYGKALYGLPKSGGDIELLTSSFVWTGRTNPLP